MAFRQCPKQLWLETHRREQKQVSAGTQASFDIGHEVGDIARRLYDLFLRLGLALAAHWLTPM